MTELISALDNFTPKQTGENGLDEYSWSNSIQERILQISFQLTRTNNSQNLERILDEIIVDLKCSYTGKTIQRSEFVGYMSVLFRMIGHTRDIIDGKGEYALSYMLLSVWNKHYPELARFAFRLFVLPPNESDASYHPFGSWKDIKYFYEKNKHTSLAQYGTELLIEQLKKDENSDNPSLASRWAPREKSKFSEMSSEIAMDYYSHYLESAKTEQSRNKAIIKAKTEFRKLLSKLNKKLDTVQIKQCSGEWSKIDPSKQTSITMHRQKRAFLNIDKKGNVRSEIDDRVCCANNFKDYTRKAVAGEVEVKGKRIGLVDFTKDALEIIRNTRVENPDTFERDLLNEQWKSNSNQTGSLGKMIAMVDVSGSMNGDPMNAAISLGIRVAEKSLLGKRVMTFSSKPTWVNLTDTDSFVDMVHKVSLAEWGMNTNFSLAMKMILDAIVSQKLHPDIVEDMVLAIFSDMQMDYADNTSGSMMDKIDDMYKETGIRLWGKPFKPPHILFWNLRSTNGFPSLSTKPNTSMMSGFSPALLNEFCEQGLTSLQSCTPWSILCKSLDNPRYSSMHQLIEDTY